MFISKFRPRSLTAIGMFSGDVRSEDFCSFFFFDLVHPVQVSHIDEWTDDHDYGATQSVSWGEQGVGHYITYKVIFIIAVLVNLGASLVGNLHVLRIPPY